MIMSRKDIADTPNPKYQVGDFFYDNALSLAAGIEPKARIIRDLLHGFAAQTQALDVMTTSTDKLQHDVDNLKRVTRFTIDTILIQ